LAALPDLLESFAHRVTIRSHFDRPRDLQIQTTPIPVALADYYRALTIDPDYASANPEFFYTALGEDIPGQADMFRAIELGIDTMQVAYAVRNADQLR